MSMSIVNSNRLHVVSEIFSIKVADKQTHTHTETPRHTYTLTDNKGRLKFAACEPTVFIDSINVKVVIARAVSLN